MNDFTDNKKLEEAEKNLEEFLKNNPRAEEFQKEINEVLNKCSHPENRLKILLEMIKERVELQQKATNLLLKTIKNMKKG